MTERLGRMLEMTAGIAANYVVKHKLPSAELPGLIANVYGALSGVAEGTAVVIEPTVTKATPAQIRKSVTDAYLISFENGARYKTLKRHLSIRGLTLAAYREKWGLPGDYPATAPGYSASRSALAKAIGLGNLGRKATAAEPAVARSTNGVVKPARRTMKPVAE
jgi:predicted transcriptional regulator